MSNEIKTRPLTPTEQKYTYAQSMQLEGQTGTIGHLRGDFATTGYGFYTTWFDTRPQWKSDEFKADLDTVINCHDRVIWRISLEKWWQSMQTQWDWLNYRILIIIFV